MRQVEVECKLLWDRAWGFEGLLISFLQEVSWEVWRSQRAGRDLVKLIEKLLLGVFVCIRLSDCRGTEASGDKRLAAKTARHLPKHNGRNVTQSGQAITWCH